MTTTPRSWKSVLRDKAGISVSIPETVISLVVKIIVITGLVGAVSVMLIVQMNTQNSTKSSSAYQAASNRFAAAVAASDEVRGTSDSVTLFKVIDPEEYTYSAERWHAADIGGKKTLVVDRFDLLYDLLEPSDGDARSGRQVMLADVDEPQFTYSNIANREMTYSGFDVSLAPGTRPTKTSADDWQDPRAKRVEMDLSTSKTRVNTYARNAVSVGITDIVNFSKAVDGAKYVVPEDPFVAPSAIGRVWATRSATTGTAYAGAREGATLSFLGGTCQDTPSIVTASWQPLSPTGQPRVSTTFTRALTGAQTNVELADVRNGAQGTFEVSVKCDVAAEPDTATVDYAQPLPDTTLTATATADERHQLRFVRVSSLNVQYLTKAVVTPAIAGVDNGWNGTFTFSGTDRNYADGTTFGRTFAYEVSTKLSEVTGATDTATLSPAWPAAPAARSITFQRTGSGAAITDGVVKWSYASSCPAGTTAYARGIQNKVWHSGSETVGNYTVGTLAAGKTQETFAPNYALEGYPYSMLVGTMCYSAKTGLQSPMADAQSGNWITEMNSPSAPIYDGYDFRDWARGDKRGYGTCWGLAPNSCMASFPRPQAWNQSYQLDFRTFCPAGSTVRASSYKTTDWAGNVNFRGFFGRQDGWQFPDAANVETVRHDDPVYTCGTNWNSSPNSAIGADVVYTMDRIWR